VPSDSLAVAVIWNTVATVDALVTVTAETVAGDVGVGVGVGAVGLLLQPTTAISAAPIDAVTRNRIVHLWT
jgi:hypothetical protein